MIGKIFRIARAEYLNSITSKAFILGVLATPLIIAVTLLVEKVSSRAKGSEDRSIAIVDHSGKLFALLEEKAKLRNENDLIRAGKKVEPAFHLTLHEAAAGESEDDLIWRLSEKVRTKDFFGFAIIDNDIFVAKLPTIRYYTNTPTYRELPDWLRQGIDEELKRERFSAAKIDEAEIQRLLRKTGIERMELAKKGDDGKVTSEIERSSVLTSLIPSIGMMMLFMMVMTAAPTLLNSTLEEKINKISEFLISAVSPFELMMGKLLGALVTALTLSITYILALVYIAHRHDMLQHIPSTLFIWFFVFLILSMMTFGAFCLAIGSACSEIRDAQSLMMPLMLLMIIPLLLWQPVMQNPSGGFATAVSLIPTATPMLMFLRIAVPPGVPWWEIALGVIGCTLFMFLAVWAAAKIFRIGILSQGQAPSFAKMMKWIFSK
jgi:ABC-2 type transport system permease protein